jgi:septal ring factor EnvC (AmiA/AmiB activator)
MTYNKTVVGFLLFLLFNAAYAETPGVIEEYSPELDDAHATSTQQQIEEAQQRTADLLAEIDRRYGETAKSIKRLNNESETKRIDLDKLHAEIDALNGEIATYQKELAGQIKAAYAMGQQEQLKLLLNQQDPSLSSRMMTYYSYINKARIAKINAISASVARLDRLNQDLQQENDDLWKSLKQKQNQQAILDSARKERQSLLAQLSKVSPEQQLSTLQGNEAKLKEIMAGLDSSESVLAARPKAEKQPEVANIGANEHYPIAKVKFAELRGRLAWPVQGRLSQKFGSPRGVGIWDGVVINASEGTEVRAVNGGKVAYADWLRGYGLLMIVDHGQDYMTLYAFNQSLYKKTGDAVAAGEVIATVGQSGGRNQTGLYFGIRKNGTALDPLTWCGK